MTRFRFLASHSTAVGAATVLALAAFPAPASPPVSRGEQYLQMNGAACMQRAGQVFQALGWSAQVQGSTLVLGLKGIHSSYITCNDLGNGYSLVNVFVASEYGAPEVAGAERVVLQQGMAGQIAQAPQPAAQCSGLRVDKLGNGVVRLSWNGAAMDGNDWYTVVPAGTPDTSWGTWDRPHAATGSRDWAGLVPGSYEFRWFLDNPAIVAARCPFSLP